MSVTRRPPLPVERRPEPERSGHAGVLWLIWFIALVVIIVDHLLVSVIRFAAPLLYLITFVACLVLFALTMYGFAIALRWTLRKLFWRVGRRLFLSYVLIGVLPFFLFAVLLTTVIYMIAGVMTQAALHGERQSTLGQMEAAAYEYGISGKRSPDAPKNLEIYDTADESGNDLPSWLRGASFSGLLWRDGGPVLVASHLFVRDGEKLRNIVLVQPIDRTFDDIIEEKSGMTVRVFDERKNTTNGQRHVSISKNEDGEEVTRDLILTNIGRKIIWCGVRELGDWKTGARTSGRELASLVINPWPNLFHFYFGASANVVVDRMAKVIFGVTVLLLLIYMFAGLFAAVRSEERR